LIFIILTAILSRQPKKTLIARQAKPYTITSFYGHGEAKFRKILRKTGERRFSLFSPVTDCPKRKRTQAGFR